MRILPAAPNPVRGTVQNAVYRGIENDFQGEIQHQIDEENSLAAKLNTANQHITRAEQRRRDGIMTLAYAFDTTNPLVVADAKTVNHLIDELTNRLEGFWGGGTGEVKSKYEQLSDDAFAACEGPGHPANCYDTTLRSTCVPALEDAHGTWWTLMGELESAANTWVEDTSRGMSAYAANLADPSANRRVLLAIEELERAEFALVVQQADFWTHYEVIFSDHCVDTGDPGDPGDAPAPGSAADPGKCPPLLRGINGSFDIAGGKLKVDCEKVSFKTAEEVAPLLSLFLDVTYTTRTGSLTAFAGVKGGGKIGGIVDAGFKSGLYITSDSEGEISDVGWRVGPSVSVGKGPIKVGSWSDEVDLSFVDALTTGP